MGGGKEKVSVSEVKEGQGRKLSLKEAVRFVTQSPQIRSANLLQICLK